jgi:hypothetical protein
MDTDRYSYVLNLSPEWGKRLEALAARVGGEEDIEGFAALLLTRAVAVMESNEAAELEKLERDYANDPDSFGKGIDIGESVTGKDLGDDIPI